MSDITRVLDEFQILSAYLCAVMLTTILYIMLCNINIRISCVIGCVQLTYTALCPSCNLEQDFLQQAIASHLMTFGRSIVVGHLADRVNLVSDSYPCLKFLFIFFCCVFTMIYCLSYLQRFSLSVFYALVVNVKVAYLVHYEIPCWLLNVNYRKFKQIMRRLK